MAEHLENSVAGDDRLALSPLALRAEDERRAGRLDDARRSAEAALSAAPDSLGARAVLALVLVEQGEAEAARQRLTELVGSLGTAAQPASGVSGALESPAALGGGIGEAELDEAFGEARAVAEEMHSVNDVAEAVLRDDALAADDDFGLPPAAPFEEGMPASFQGELEAEPLLAASVALEPEPAATAALAEAPADALDLFSEPAFATETMAALLEGQGDRSSADAIRSAISAGDGPSSAPPTTGERTQLIATLEGWLANLRGASR